MLPKHDRRLYATAALAFIASAAATVIGCCSMAEMPGMEMPGGWIMSMAWMRLPEQTWLEAGGTFLAMWTVMMIAMMLPVFVLELQRFRRSASGSGTAPTLSVAAGYFGVWAAVGLCLFPLGAGFNALAMKSKTLSEVTPLLGGLVVMIAGALQFTDWKRGRLVRCRHEDSCRGSQSAKSGKMLRAGARMGVKCVYCCIELTAVLLVAGVMNPIVMALVTTAICTERLSRTLNMARVVGAGVITAGLLLVGRAVLV